MQSRKDTMESKLKSRFTVLKLVLDDELAGWVGTRFFGWGTPRDVDKVIARLHVLYARSIRLWITVSWDCGGQVPTFSSLEQEHNEVYGRRLAWSICPINTTELNKLKEKYLTWLVGLPIISKFFVKPKVIQVTFKTINAIGWYNRVRQTIPSLYNSIRKEIFTYIDDSVNMFLLKYITFILGVLLGASPQTHTGALPGLSSPSSHLTNSWLRPWSKGTLNLAHSLNHSLTLIYYDGINWKICESVHVLCLPELGTVTSTMTLGWPLPAAVSAQMVISYSVSSLRSKIFLDVRSGSAINVSKMSLRTPRVAKQ